MFFTAQILTLEKNIKNIQVIGMTNTLEPDQLLYNFIFIEGNHKKGMIIGFTMKGIPICYSYIVKIADNKIAC
jgi:hypothetical protein